MKIIHVMSDGTVRDSVEGLVIPTSLQAAYQILANHQYKNKESERKKNNEESADCA